MISVTLYLMAKRRNSTRQPDSGNISIKLTGRFVTPSSMYTPTLILNVSENQNIGQFNYMGISWPKDATGAKTRYYWVVDKVICENGQVLVTGIEDVFATFKSNIFTSVQFVVRSNNAVDNEYLDDAVPTTTKPTITRTQLENQFNIFTSSSLDSLTAGCFIIGCIAEEVQTFDGRSWTETLGSDYSNLNSNGMLVYGAVEGNLGDPLIAVKPKQDTTEAFTRGSVRYYTMTPLEAKIFFKLLATVKNIAADFNIGDHFISCVYCPIATLSGAPTETVFLFGNDGQASHYTEGDGSTQVLLACKGLTRLTYINTKGQGIYNWKSGIIELNKHTQWQASSDTVNGIVYGNFINYPPYHNVKLQYGPFGEIDLPLDELYEARYDRFRMVLNMQCDLATGLGSLRVLNSAETRIVSEIKTTLGIPIPLVSITSDSYIKEFTGRHDEYYTAIQSGLSVAGSAAPESQNIFSSANYKKQEVAKYNTDVSKAYAISNRRERATALNKLTPPTQLNGGKSAIPAIAANTASLAAGCVETQYKRKLTGMLSSIPSVKLSGSNGSVLGYDGACFAIIYKDYNLYARPETYYSEIGALCYKYSRLAEFATSSIGFKVGFVVCENAQLVNYPYNNQSKTYLIYQEPDNSPSKGLTLEEQQVICDQLNSGLYLE